MCCCCCHRLLKSPCKSRLGRANRAGLPSGRFLTGDVKYQPREGEEPSAEVRFCRSLLDVGTCALRDTFPELLQSGAEQSAHRRVS